MPYVPVPLGPHVPPAVVGIVRDVIDNFFSDFRFLLTIVRPKQGSSGSLQRPLAMLLLSLIDGASQLLHPDKMKDGARFKGFLGANYPWDLDAPEGLSTEEACSFIWEEARYPLIHRFGLRALSASDQAERPKLKFGRVFTSTDETITSLEAATERPFSDPSIKRSDGRVVFWIESLYWGLRISITRSLDTEAKARAVEAWLKSGEFDHKKKRR